MNHLLYTNLVKTGFTSFNLKDYDVNLYNKLREKIPYNQVSSVVTPYLIKFVFCAKIFTDLDTFFKKLEPLLSNAGYDLKNQDYLSNKTKEYKKQEDYLEGESYIRMDFPSSDFIMLQKIKEIIFSNFKFAQDQSWYETYSLRVNIGNTTDFQRFFRDMVHDILQNHYIEDISRYFSEENFLASITNFSEKSLIKLHKDGFNPERLAVILLYLNDDWEDEFGGQLVIDQRERIQPEFGNVTILDFTKNNIYHEVLEVIGNRHRYAYVSFLDIRNM